MVVSESNGTEDRSANLKSTVDAHLGGYGAVEKVNLASSGNPNRISIDFVKNRTRNAKRIELFCNARESESVVSLGASGDGNEVDIFLHSEYIRQVTFSLSQEFGVA